MITLPTFKKVQCTISSADNKSKEAKKGEHKEGNKKCKNENSNGNLVKNHGQPDEFKVAKEKHGRVLFQQCFPKIDLYGTRK
jgi:hypothetical protein